MDDSIKTLTAGLQKLAASETANETPVPFRATRINLPEEADSATSEIAQEISAYLDKKRKQDERAASITFTVK